MSVVLELFLCRVIADHATVRIARGPDPALIVLRHPHGHLRSGFAAEGELSLLCIEFNEVAVEVCVIPVAARQDRCERAIISRGKGHQEFFALSRLCINAKEGVATPMVEEPDKNDVPSLSVCGGNDAAMIAGGGGYTVMKESIAERLGGMSHRLFVLITPSILRLSSVLFYLVSLSKL